MTIHRSRKPIWHTDVDSGLIYPGGTDSHLTETSSQSYLAIKEKACAVEQIYNDHNTPLSPSCDLAKLISDAKELSDAWQRDRAINVSGIKLFRVGFLDRIANAILPLKDIKNPAHYLKAVVSGNLDLFARNRSPAKDILWELELWATLKRRGFAADLQEPPDIVTRFEGATVGIACKKLYSEKHVQNVLSQAVGQIEASFDFGIVALNLDDLIPANQILKTPDISALSRFVDDINVVFLKNHQRHLRKYLAPGRLLSVLVSTGLLADVTGASTRFNTARQSTLWTIPGLPPEKEKQLQRFYTQLMS